MPTIKHLEGRRDLLREYLGEIVQELVRRGIIDAGAGRDPLDRLLKKHLPEIALIMIGDLKDAGAANGKQLIGGLLLRLL